MGDGARQGAVMQLFRPSLLPAAADIARHHHREPYATVVLAGGYEEAGDAGRIAAQQGEVLLHGPFSAHRDRISAKRTLVLDLPLPFDGRDWPARARIADPDRIVRLAECDPRAAVAVLLDGLAPAPADEAGDVPDQLSTALRTSAATRIGEWAAARERSREHVSRSFEKLYGVSPAAYRADCQAKRTWRMIVAGGDSLAGIAVEAGYADQAHMTRSVTRLTGMSPRRWREYVPG
ncbi:MAG: helix-turn-helix transcriptional regulator [Sphingopyxis sp.]|uniref:helix-turn-helix domain-containing protein n=1 Tax=Sphingopyxis sp. TaxID=1908224 RepID=UPI001A2C4807|nr:AraC family transcriptional regulator [Sphingopyxis sp.]MBJ7499868.1 helix-turn-helix transcriptional regulator [Sphingopyxis sp.]